MDGAGDGGGERLRYAFHGEARMVGAVDGQRYDEPICSFFELCQKHPLANNGSYRSRIISTTRVGGAAMVMVAEDGCWGSAAFVDFFTVTRIGGAWKITNKTFAHSGGEIPQEVLND